MAARLVVIAALLVLATAAYATTFSFAAPAEARAIVSARDDYIARLGALERSLKAKAPAPVSEAQFLQLAASGVRAWRPDERKLVEQALETLRPQLAALRLPLPDSVVLVRASGAGEGGASHTRGEAVVLTDEALQRPALVPFLLAHELFHIASRHDRAWRDRLYATIGFAVIDELELPPELAARRITNPDAPRLDVALRVSVAGQPLWVAPLLQATVDRYDPARGGEFFATMQLAWIEIGRGEAPPAQVRLQAAAPLLQTGELDGFFEQVGRNTAYIIHPEEILADNFAQLATGQTGPSPEIHQRIRAALTAR